jgi:RNA polymerase sigma factor (sigma-70 family)
MDQPATAARDGATDGEAIARSLRSPRAFATIFDRHFAVIHRYLARRVGEEVADDLASQVFVIAFARRETFRSDRVDARPWLYGIAANLLRNHWRSEQRLLAVLGRLSNEAIVAQRADETVANDARVARALAELDSDHREVILLHVWADLTHAEIAEALGVPLGTVASRLSRARGRLRELLGDLPVHHSLALTHKPTPTEEP